MIGGEPARAHNDRRRVTLQLLTFDGGGAYARDDAVMHDDLVDIDAELDPDPQRCGAAGQCLHDSSPPAGGRVYPRHAVALRLGKFHPADAQVLAPFVDINSASLEVAARPIDVRGRAAYPNPIGEGQLHVIVDPMRVLQWGSYQVA